METVVLLSHKKPLIDQRYYVCAVAPEAVVINLFKKEIEEAGYSHTKELFRIKWTDKVDYELLGKIVVYIKKI